MVVVKGGLKILGKKEHVPAEATSAKAEAGRGVRASLIEALCLCVSLPYLSGSSDRDEV